MLLSSFHFEVSCPSAHLCWVHQFADAAFRLVQVRAACFILFSCWMTFTFALLQVWNHFDSGSCPGQAIGVKTRLDNGVAGFIPTKFLSDKVVKRPEERVKVWKGWIFMYPARTGRAWSQWQWFRVWLITPFPKWIFKPYFHWRTLDQQHVQVLISVHSTNLSWQLVGTMLIS